MKLTYPQIIAQHQTLLKEENAEATPERLERVKTFIADVAASGVAISKSSERELLRSILRYWSAYIYDHTKEFPASQLVPAVVIPQLTGQRWIVAGIIFGALLLIGLGWSLKDAIVASTQVPPASSTATTLVATSSLVESDTPAPTDTVTPEPSPTEIATLLPTPLSTPQGGGGQIAFVSERTGRPQIFIMDVDGSKVTQLTNLADGACQPAWSPDGQQLLFISPCNGKRDIYPNASIYVMMAEGSNQQLLIRGASSAFDPAWSVNDKLAFTAWDGKGRPKLFVANANGSDPQNFSTDFSTDSQPAWSPDGKQLAFRNGTRSGYGRIYWMYEDGSFEGANPDEVSAPDVVASDPDWSPDGEYVIYSARNQLWLAEWDKFGNVVEPVAFSNLSMDADWSPDGLWITFESWRDGTANHDIYIMTPAGGLITRLTTDLARDYQPAWRPPTAATGR